MKRRVPGLTTDEEAEAFLETDLSDLDFSQFRSGRLRFEERSTKIEEPAPSETYRLFERAMTERRQIVCMYDGHRRELCPILLGHSQGEEKALTYQFGGDGKSGLAPGGQWKCLRLLGANNVQLRDGPWRAGSRHRQKQTCVEVVDLDINPDSPYNPKRRLADLANGLTTPKNKSAVPTAGHKKPKATAK